MGQSPFYQFPGGNSIAAPGLLSFSAPAGSQNLAVSASDRMHFTTDSRAIGDNPMPFVAASDRAVFSDIARHGPFLGKAASDLAIFSDFAHRNEHYSVHARDECVFSDRAREGFGDDAADSAVFTDLADCSVYLGRYRRGDVVQLPFSSDSVPDAAPVVVIVKTTGGQVDAFPIPATDRSLLDFGYPLFIGQPYSLGSFRAYCHFTIGGVEALKQATFDVIAGGDSGGAVISLHGVDRPEARSVIAQLASGRLVLGSNPRLN